MLDDIKRILLEKCHLNPNQLILVGFSGGPDSLCLLDILNKLGYPMIVAHLDHGLRPESKNDAKFVRKFSENLGLQFCLKKENINTYAQEFDFTLEEAGRDARYKFLFSQAKSYGAQAVAVGHNANDQTETVLMHILRGAGLAGLRGMQIRSIPNEWSEDIPLIRPLLSTRREDILKYLSDRNLRSLLDTSNLDTRIFRNRLRHKLIPYLQKFNPQVNQRIWQMAEILQEDYSVIMKVVDESWHECIELKGEGYINVHRKNFLNQPLGVQRHIIRKAIKLIKPGIRDVSYNSVNRAISFISIPNGSSYTNLFADIQLLVEDEFLWIFIQGTLLPSDDHPQYNSENSLRLDIPGIVTIADGWRLKIEIVNTSSIDTKKIQSNTNAYHAFIDLSISNSEIYIRHRQPGDRIKPLGMEGHSIKLSDFFINEKLPFRFRNNWPLICTREEIIWIPGYRLAYPYRVTEVSEEILSLSLSKDLFNINKDF